MTRRQLLDRCFRTIVASRGIGTGSAAACTATGDLEILDFHSKIFGQVRETRKLRILLPRGYRDRVNKNRRYPVLYLNDGQNLFDICTATFSPVEWNVDETTDRLIAENKVEPLIVVGIDNAGKRDRAKEYLPFPDDTLKPFISKVQGTNYPVFLTQEVIPFVSERYRVETGSENRGLGGSSYGGLIAFYTVLHTRNVFGRVLIESPAIEVDDYEVLKEAAHHKDWPERIYLGAGTEEDPPGAVNSLPKDLAKIARLLEANGVRRDRIMVNITGGQHDERAWSRRFPTALEFLFPAARRVGHLKHARAS